MRAVLLGSVSGLLVGAVALVAVVGFAWPFDHRRLTTEKDTRPVVLPATFAGLPGLDEPTDDTVLWGDELGGRPAVTQIFAQRDPIRAVGVSVTRGWTTGDSRAVSGPQVQHGSVTCVSPVTFRSGALEDLPDDPPATFPLYCERLGDTLSVSALVVAPVAGAHVTPAQLAAEVDALWLAHR